MAIDIDALKAKVHLNDRYERQLTRIQAEGKTVDCIKQAVEPACGKLKHSATSMVIYGDPQSGKTEMMICLTAKLLDQGHRVIVHLMNDSVDLLSQNLQRFRQSGLAPAPRTCSDLPDGFALQGSQELVVFCKKNAKDLEKLIARMAGITQLVVIDDEADYATPNAKVNKQTKTKINELVGQLLGNDGHYIGVTATPARLDLNNTFHNDTDKWVKFPSHDAYTGPDTFFPIDTKNLPFRKVAPASTPEAQPSRTALLRFLVTSGYLNIHVNPKEKNYSMLMHTSGKKDDHASDRAAVEQTLSALTDTECADFGPLVTEIHAIASQIYPGVNANQITEYVVENASRASLVVLNSDSDRKSAGDNPTVPTSPFTVIIGGNIVSRGVTFPNLLAMYFTRNVKHKLQQDTYIQRARMFGARGEFLEHFELTIPDNLYDDWHRCFVFHRLALETVAAGMGSPVWLGDSTVSVAAASSIDKATVTFDTGEMSFARFDMSANLDDVIKAGQTTPETLKQLQEQIGTAALPDFLIKYVEAALVTDGTDALAIHTASALYGSADQETISRDKGLIGKSQLEIAKFPNAVHHFKIFFNAADKARLFYKQTSRLSTLKNSKAPAGTDSGS